MMNEYVAQLNNNDSSLFQEMEQYANIHRIPIIEKESLHVLLALFRVHNSKRIIEIGTAIGYSALQIAHHVRDAEVISFEKNEVRYRVAQSYREKSEHKKRVTFIYEDALSDDVFLEETRYDALFIDAAKGKNKLFFEKYTAYLRPGALVITDNVFFRGYVYQPEQAPKRWRSLAKKTRAYNEWLKNHPSFETTFLNVGDGLAISIKKET